MTNETHTTKPAKLSALRKREAELGAQLDAMYAKRGGAEWSDTEEARYWRVNSEWDSTYDQILDIVAEHVVIDPMIVDEQIELVANCYG